MELSKDISKECVSVVNGTDGSEARSKFWIAVYTRPRSEKKVSSELDKSGIENYLPTQIRISQWSDRKKKIVTVVIPMVVFVRVSQSQILQIKKNPLVLKVLSKPGKKDVAVIPDADIEKLKFILGQTDIPVSIDPYALSVNENVRIRRGPLMGTIGEVVATDGDDSEIMVSLNILGGARVRISRVDLERLKV